MKRKATSDNNLLITQSTVDLTQETPNWKEELDKIVKESNKQMSEKIELQNKQMKATIKESVNSTLLEFQSHIISSVEGMMALQLEQINKSIASNIQTAMQSSQIVKKNSEIVNKNYQAHIISPKKTRTNQRHIKQHHPHSKRQYKSDA